MPSTVIQWFPGHMAKTRRLIAQRLPLVDIVIEVLDARIPISSKNPEILSLCGKKPILTIFNKSSLADKEVNKQWTAFYKAQGQHPLFVDCKTGTNIQHIEGEIRSILAEKIKKNEEKGMAGRRLKAMVVGIPNVGKSTLINKLSGAAKAKAEDRPGVTLREQWVSAMKGIDLLDMPGVLWPKFEDQQVGQCLAATGAIKDDILDLEQVSSSLCEQLRELAPNKFCARYKLNIDQIEGLSGREICALIGKKRGMLLPGGAIDTDRANRMILDEFREAKIGQISLETPAMTKKQREVTDV